MPRLTSGGIELIDLYRSFREFSENFKFAAERFDDFSQRGNLHIGLFCFIRKLHIAHNGVEISRSMQNP